MPDNPADPWGERLPRRLGLLSAWAVLVGSTIGSGIFRTPAVVAGRVDDPGLSPTTPATDLPFGVPAPYWLALRNYQPVTVAASLARPMLLLQGGRDYQVTVVDDLALWEQGLRGRENVSIRVYPADNHLFLPGSGPSTPAELEPAQHLDPDVITDIAVWLAESGA